MIFVLLPFCFEFVAAAQYALEEDRLEHLCFVNASDALFTELFTTRNYKKEMSPIYTKEPKSSELSDNGTERTFPRFNVNITMGYTKIMEINEAQQLISIVTRFILKWYDIRLTWNPEDHYGIKHIYVHRDFVWFPENCVYDAQTLTEVNADYIATVKIGYDGKVTYDHSFYAQIACRLNVATFPFDTQICGINFISYSYPMAQVDMTGNIRGYDFKYYTSNGEWLVENLTTGKHVQGMTDFRFDNLNFSLHIKRNPHFYIYVIALPCFILTFLSVIGMFWTPNVKEEQIGKLSIGLTSLMSMTVLLDMVSQQIPKTVTFPLLGIYVIICVVIIGVASVVLVMFTSKPEPEERKRIWTLMEKLRWQIFSLHFGLLLLFEMLNVANFVVLMAHWT